MRWERADKDLKGGSNDFFEATIPAFILKYFGKLRKPSIWIAGNPTIPTCSVICGTHELCCGKLP